MMFFHLSVQNITKMHKPLKTPVPPNIHRYSDTCESPEIYFLVYHLTTYPDLISASKDNYNPFVSVLTVIVALTLYNLYIHFVGSGGDIEVQTNISRGRNVTTMCSEGFYLDVSLGVCKPECGKLSIYTEGVKVLMNCLIIISLFVGIIGGTVVWVLSCFNCKQA